MGGDTKSNLYPNYTVLKIGLKMNIWNLETLTSFFTSLLTSVCRGVLLAAAVTAARLAAASPAFYQHTPVHLQGDKSSTAPVSEVQLHRLEATVCTIHLLLEHCLTSHCFL